MTDNHTTDSYAELDWLQSTEDESESDFGSRSTSSTLSWTDDAERQISEEMRAQYELFESALYSELDGEELPEPILKEVALWKQHSPHLRISGTQIIPTFNEIEDKYPEDYEEIFGIHSDMDNIADCFKEQCIISDESEIESYVETDEKITDEFIENKCLDVKSVEFVSNSKIDSKLHISKIHSPKKENVSFHVLDDALVIREAPFQKDRRVPLSSRGCISRHEYKCNHMRENEDTDDLNSQIKTSIKQNKLSPAKMRRRYPSYSASRAARRISTASSVRLQKRKSIVSELTPLNPRLPLRSDSGTYRHGILPPIQTIPIPTPKLPNKRANSAMLRFSKTLPRTRPNTSRTKPIILTPIDDSDNSDRFPEQTGELEILPRGGDGPLSPIAQQLPYRPVSKQPKQLQVPRRWRY